MRVVVNGARLYFDVEGAGLVPDGPRMRAKPTLILLHGGPGFDHSLFKPWFSQLADLVQVVYLDHRGNGRSDASSPERWNLAQWADDVHGLCQALEIEHPIVWGTSFGGTVAIAYATRYPAHPSKLILVSTEAKGGSHLDRRVAMFERLGGAEVGALARRRFIDGQSDPAIVEQWLKVGFPHYTRTPRDPDAGARVLRRPEVTNWFVRPDGEVHRFDYLMELSRVRCPTLVMGGEEDPMISIESQEDIVAALPPSLVRFERFAGCGHAVLPDAPDRALPVVRDFIAA